MPALNEIFFVIKGVKVFPFKQLDENKGEVQRRIAQIKNDFRRGDEKEIKIPSKRFNMIQEWLSLEGSDLVS